MNPPRKSVAGPAFGLRLVFRLLGWGMSAAVALVVLLYIAMPAALRFGIPQALSRYGIASSIESARIDISAETITLVGFNVGPDDGPGIRWGEVRARVDMSALLKGNLRIIDFQVKDARVDLKQLAAVKWDLSATDAEGRPPALPLDVGETAIRDLKFIGLSEKLGRPVSIRTLKFANLAQLNTGDQVAFELNAELGQAPLRLVGRAKMEGDLPVVEGRYELGAFVLDGVTGALGMSKTASLTGRTDGAGTFILRYESGIALVRLGISGRLAVTDFTLDSPTLTLTEGGMEWDGTINLELPVDQRQPVLGLEGSAVANRVVAEYKRRSDRFQVESGGLRWKGELQFDEALSTEGRFEADEIQIRGPKSAGEWQIETRGTAFDAVRSARDKKFSVTAATSREAGIFLNRDGIKRNVTLASVSISNLQMGDNGYAIDSASVESAQSNAVDDPSAARWDIAGAAVTDVEITDDGALRVAKLNARRAQMKLATTDFSTTDASAEDLAWSRDTDWTVGALSLASLMYGSGDSATWGNGLEMSDGQYARNGDFSVNSLDVGRVTQSTSGQLDWEINRVRVRGISAASDSYRADEAEVSSFAHRIGAADAVEIDGAKAIEIAYGFESDVRTRQLQFAQLRYRRGEIQSLELTDATAETPVYVSEGRFTAEKVKATLLRYTDENADASRFENIAVSGVAGDANTGVRVESATVESLRYDSAVGTDFDGRTLALDNVDAVFGGTIGAGQAKLAELHAGVADGMDFSLNSLAVKQPVLGPVNASLSAAGVSAGELGLRQGANRRLSVFVVEGGKVEPRADGGHAVSGIRARRVEAMDEVIGTRLEAGSLSIEQLTADAQGRIGIERGNVAGFTIADTRGTPQASFSARDIIISRAGIAPGKLVDLGEVQLEDVVTVAGFSELGRFVLPKAPFSDGGEKSTLHIALDRLKTSGDAKLSFFDRSTMPPFELSLSRVKASMENYHSGDPAKLAAFALEGQVDEFSALKVDGTVSHRNDGMDLNLAGKVTAFELKRLNTYAAIHAGRTIRDGRGDANFDIKIKGQKLTGDTQLVFSKVKFGPGGKSTLSSQAQNLSLDGAFAMLKDKDDIVRLSVSLSGSLDDPQFDFSDAVAQAVVKTVQNTVMLTFKPLGLLASVAGLVGVGSGMKFNPVVFDSGDGNLNGQGLTYLDGLAGKLQKHPKLDLKICGRAVPADLAALNPGGSTGAASAGADSNLKQRVLAETRATVVRQYLIEKKNIASARLLDCAPEVESTAGSLPRTEMLVHIEGEPQPVAVEPKAKGTAN